MDPHFTISDFASSAKIRVKNLMDGADSVWSTHNRKLVIIDKGGYRYIVTGLMSPFLLKYKQRGKNWKWVSLEDILGRETLSENVQSDSTRKSSLALRSIFKRLVPYIKPEINTEG